jgi:hypothetical protein
MFSIQNGQLAFEQATSNENFSMQISTRLFV